MQVHVSYWRYGVRNNFKVDDFEVLLPPECCCPEMAHWWDVIFDCCMVGPRRPESITAAVFIERLHSTEGACDGVPIRYCPFCGREIVINATLNQSLAQSSFSNRDE